MGNFKKMQEDLAAKIQESYESGTSVEAAERLAAEFLHAQLIVGAELAKADLDSRMRKSGVKSVRAAMYMDAASKGDKKPTEAALASILDSNEIISGEQQRLDEAEASHAELKRIYDVYTNAHIYYRGVAKGSFGV